MNRINSLILSLAAFASASFFEAPSMAAENILKPANSKNFSLELFRHVAANNRKNVLISPFGAYEVLSMTANGAYGSTKAAMAKALGITGESFDSINSRNQSVLNELNSNDKVKLEIANAIYADKKTPFKTSFIDLCRKFYQGEAKSEDFKDPSTVDKINAWCDKKTHGKIKIIIDILEPDERMVLLNSVYFKGSWERAFRLGQPQDFDLLSGSTKQVPMMLNEMSTEYLRGDDFQAVSIPYAGKRQVMFVFLPDKGASVSALAQKFTSQNWQEWLGRFETKTVNLTVPKYKIEFSAELNKSLSKMGMAEAFSDDAKFSEMSETAVQISSVMQKTYVDVNELGTEAAAVTSTKMSLILSLEEPPIDFAVNRPFIVILMDKGTGELLFLGQIVDP